MLYIYIQKYNMLGCINYVYIFENIYIYLIYMNRGRRLLWINDEGAGTK